MSKLCLKDENHFLLPTLAKVPNCFQFDYHHLNAKAYILAMEVYY